MTYAEALAYFDGNASAMARALGMHKRSVYAWRENGSIPFLRQLQLEELTKGTLKSEPLPYANHTSAFD
jgi:hypothetical protein